ncbi:MAG: glycosyltransferase family 2 protein [Anaerolineaceae bacterium]|nr:glycosyltransferase family 2 protein [Anaerolineaceae bacterium]
MNPIKISVIAPIFNEEDCLHELHNRISGVFAGQEYDWELLMISDGSIDRSNEIIIELAEKDPAHIRPIIFARNFGHQIAVTAGLDYSQGDAVVIIDADLQDPPELILEMIEKWKEGFEVVYAVRGERAGESKFKLFTASLFYRLIQKITEVNIPLDTGDFRLMDRKVVDTLNTMRERHRFLRGMSAWVGFSQIGVKYNRSARYAGETKYPLKKMLKFALNAITSFSYFPLQLATYLGIFCALLSLLAIIFVVILRLSGSQAFYGQATTLTVVLFLGSIQLISLGILGEYIGRLYDEAKGRPLYIVSKSPDDILKKEDQSH